MLHDLDKTLEKLLRDKLPKSDGADINLSFDTPDRESIKRTPAINLFLYDIRENLELRSSISTFVRQDNGAGAPPTAIKKRADVYVDCAYLITAWPSTTSDPALEHQLLGNVMKVLLRHPRLPPDCLQGSLIGQAPPIRAKILRASQLQSLGEFWQAMGGKPKATLSYTVTVAMPVHDDSDPTPLVANIGSDDEPKPNLALTIGYHDDHQTFPSPKPQAAQEQESQE